MHVDDWHTTTNGDQVDTYIAFADPTGKHHRVDITYGFMSAEIAKLTFDGQALTQLPQYRALSKYLKEHGLDMDYRALDVLACTRPDDDHVNDSNPTCKGWHNVGHTPDSTRPRRREHDGHSP